MAADGSPWDPAQYERFKIERSRPFFDLLALVHPRPRMRVADLGCGTGELTRTLHEKLGARETIGIDSSETMLAKATSVMDEDGSSLRFEQAQVESWKPSAPLDLIFSNAALHWVDGHSALFARLRDALAPRGQLAVQMPANDDHPSHAVAAEVAAEIPFRSALRGFVRRSSVLPLERYAELLNQLGFEDMNVRMQVYAHRLASREDVVEWVKGTLLTDYAKRMSAELYAQFLHRYREALFAKVSDERPFFYPYKRVLLWAEASA